MITFFVQMSVIFVLCTFFNYNIVFMAFSVEELRLLIGVIIFYALLAVCNDYTGALSILFSYVVLYV